MSTAASSRLAALSRQIAALRTAEQPAPSPIQFAKRTGIIVDPWQAAVLTSDAPRILLNCSRQSGKSTITALLGLHTALYQPGSLVLLVSRAERQSKELFRKALAAYRTLDRPVDPEAENKLELELVNGSRIVALPGSEGTIRSFSGVRLLLVDEASRVPDETYFAVRPMLAVSGGRIVAMSTPFGRRGWFWEAWDQGDGWERVQITAPKCPRITPEFLAEERAIMPAWWFNQEYLCEFEADAGAVFSGEAIAAAFTPDVRPLYGAA
jgi:hypothetical protein